MYVKMSGKLITAPTDLCYFMNISSL